MPALPLLEIQGESFRINTENINLVLNKALDLPIVIVSMNGKLREGKSYVLNYFIRYLKHGGREDWFEAELSKDEIFPWQSGSHRVTAGINIWSEPFLHNHNGQKVAILLLDCQGLYDECTTQQQNAAIFSLSCLLSSVMIYNAKNKIEDDLLQKMGFFSNYTKAVSSITPGHEDTRPCLMFLLRDFEFITEFHFGFHNKDNQPQPVRGEHGNYFNRIFKPTVAMSKENRSIREALQECYKDIGMFLMPYPGTNFIEDSINNPPEIRFQKILKELVEHTMDNLVTKRLGEEEVTGRSFQPYVNMWTELCENGEFPESLTIEEMSAKLQNTVAAGEALEIFKEKFRIQLSSDDAVSDEEFKRQFEIAVEEAVDYFESKRSLGSKESVALIANVLKLRNDCESHFEEHCVPINRNRRREKNTAAIKKAQNYFNLKFRDFLSSARAGIDDQSFERLFDVHFRSAEEIFNANRASESVDRVQVYVEALKRDCRLHFEGHCKPLNQQLRHERNTRAVAMALDNFQQYFREFLSSDKAGIEDEKFELIRFTALGAALGVFHTNRSSGSDVSVQRYISELTSACDKHFHEEYVPRNQSLRREWMIKMALIGVGAVGAGAAAVVAARSTSAGRTSDDEDDSDGRASTDGEAGSSDLAGMVSSAGSALAAVATLVELFSSFQRN